MKLNLIDFTLTKHFLKLNLFVVRVLNFNITSMRFLTYPRYDAVVRKNHVTKTDTFSFRTSNSLLHKVEIDFYLIRTSDEDVLPIYNSSC